MDKRKENEEKKKKGGRAVGGGEEKEKEKKKKKKERKFPSRSLANQRSKLVGARGKVGLRDNGYTWVLKSEFFVEVPKGRGFSYIGYFLASGHVRSILV